MPCFWFGGRYDQRGEVVGCFAAVVEEVRGNGAVEEGDACLEGGGGGGWRAAVGL